MKAKILLLSVVAFLQLRCSDDNSLSIDQKVNSSAWVTIVDNQGNPLKNVKITIDDLHGLTDVEGHFLLRNVSISSNAYLQAEKSGFFTGSRRFYASADKVQYVNIVLLPQIEKGIFNSSAGATMPVDSKSSLIFPEDAINDAGGSPYSGTVHMMAYPIYADDPALSEKMPGILTGTDINGNVMSLGSFGMLAVELQDEHGSKLQVANGKMVEMRIRIPDDMLSTAPSIIPLWYFNEEDGDWKEEGHADKIGNEYVGNVAHFSFWNCDDPMNAITWDASLVFESGGAAAGMNICLTNQRNNTSACGVTNNAGFVSGLVPANELLTMEVYDPCGNIIYTKVIGPFSGNHSSGILGLPDSNLSTMISGRAVDCNNKPITNGYIRIDAHDKSYVFGIDNADGSFEQTIIACNGETSLTVIDQKEVKSSLPIIFQAGPSHAAGNIKVCDSLDQYIRFRVKGFNKEYIFYFFNTTVYNDPGYTNTSIQSIDTIGHSGTFGFGFDGVSTGTYANVQTGSRVNLPNGEYGFVINLNVNVTYFGAIGDFIKGNFAGKITAGSNGAGGHGYSDFDGTFAVRRNP